MAHSTLEDVPEQIFTESTIRRMFGLINSGKADPDLQKFIYGLVNTAMPGKWKDYKRELVEIFNWYKKNIDYRRDPYGVELLQDALATLDRRRGDCDDATVFLATAAEILGSPTRIVTVSTRPDKEPNHVYAEAMVGGRWLGLDGTIKQSYVGWTPPRVTDRKIWTRKELGLGGDDFSEIEGLGMSGTNGDIYNHGNFRGTMTPVSGRLAPGVPDDISETFAGKIPGTPVISRRTMHTYPVANNSEWTSMPRPGGGVFNPPLPIKGRPTPAELWYLVDRKLVPKVLDPDAAWWGKVPTSKEDLNRMFPGSEGTMASYLKDIASVPASAIAEVENDVRTQLARGEIGVGDVGAAVQEALEHYAKGYPPRMKMLPSQRPPRTHVGRGRGHAWGRNRRPGSHPMPPIDRRFLVPGPRKLVKGGRLNGLGELGDAITDAAKAISAGVQTGAVPPSSIEQAINSVVGAITGQPPKMSTAETRATSTADMFKNAVPIGMLALLGGAAWLISRSGGRKYRRNPSRRRGRGGSRGGGIDPKTLLLWGGGAAAAYFLLLRPGATLLPSSLAPKPAAPALSTEQAAMAAGLKAAPSIFDAISKLFGGGSSATTPSGGSGFVTNYSQLTSPPVPSIQQPSSSGFVTSYT